jgi:orotidine-5'-phosphate decarboxylase
MKGRRRPVAGAQERDRLRCAAMQAAPFGERLAAAVAARESQIVLGIDPDPARLWPAALASTGESRAELATLLAAAEHAAQAFGGGAGPSRDIVAGPDRHDDEPRAGSAPPGAGRASEATPPDTARLEAAAAVLAHGIALIDAAGPACVAAKPQLACFERLGFGGWLALDAVCRHARAAGLLVLADGKRGDVPVSAAAYAQALLGATPSPFGAAQGLDADAITANPLMGGDALEPLIAAARSAGAGVFALVRTSNAGAADLLDLRLDSGEPMWERLAALVAELGDSSPQGLADVGAVTGATAPEHLERMRELMPRTPFLLPGVGAQGGDVTGLAAAFAPGRAAGLVTASRSIANAHERAGAGDPASAARAEAERLRALAWDLS